MTEIQEALSKISNDLLVSRQLGISRNTVRRWRRGVTAPHPLMLETVLAAIAAAQLKTGCPVNPACNSIDGGKCTNPDCVRR